MAKDSCHDTELMRITLQQIKRQEEKLGIECLNEGVWCITTSWESSYGPPVPLNSHSYTICNRSQDTVEKVLNTKWIVTISYEELQPSPETAETRRCWSSCSLGACQAKRFRINIRAFPTLSYINIQFTYWSLPCPESLDSFDNTLFQSTNCYKSSNRCNAIRYFKSGLYILNASFLNFQKQ